MTHRAAHPDGIRTLLHILVIDDEERFTRLMGQLLERADYRASVALSGVEALRVCRQESPDLAVVDIFMPRTNGLDLIRRLKRDFETVKIIAMSGGGTIAGRDCLELAREAGADATLRKPVSVAKVLEAVAEVLGQTPAPPESEQG